MRVRMKEICLYTGIVCHVWIMVTKSWRILHYFKVKMDTFRTVCLFQFH